MDLLLEEYLEEYPNLELFYADHTLYSRFRTYEQSLVSVLDKGTHEAVHKIVALRAYGEELGIASFTVHNNPMRQSRRKLYARIDLVIVPPFARGNGISNVVVMGSLVEILKVYGDELYSISCLAGHDAIAHILLKHDFQEKEKKESFRPFEQQIDGNCFDRVFATYGASFALCLKSTNYKLRQRRD